MRIFPEMLKSQAEVTGFRTDILEKVGLLIHLLEALLPFTATEMEFLDRLLARGEINPELLTADEDLQDRIRRHPLLEWKALVDRSEFRGYGFALSMVSVSQTVIREIAPILYSDRTVRSGHTIATL